MKRLLLLLPLLLSVPTRAQVDPAVHKLCSDVKDYSGCVQTQLSLSNKAKPELKIVETTEPTELTPWQKHLNENPSLKAWVDANPTLGAKKRKEWEESVKRYPKPVKSAGCYRPDLVGNELIACIERQQALQSVTFEKNQVFRGDPFSDSYRRNESRTSGSYSSNGCPPGKRQYRKTALFGLIKGRKLCLSDYEAETLRAGQLRDFQNNLRDFQNSYQNNRPRFVNCTSHAFGNYVSTSCY